MRKALGINLRHKREPIPPSCDMAVCELSRLSQLSNPNVYLDRRCAVLALPSARFHV